MDRLKREENPPAGFLASPIPQFYNPCIGDYQVVQGITNQANNKTAMFVESRIIECTFTEEYTSNQTNLEIITPAVGNKLMVTDVSIHTKANSGIVKLDFNGIKVARLYSSVNNRFSPVVGSIIGNIDEALLLTTTTGNNEVFISVSYIEIKE